MSSKRLLLVGMLCCMFTLSLVAWSAPENLVFILDASNSMNKSFDGESRLDVAKEAMADLLGTLPEGIGVGVFVYGHRVSKNNEEASCQDIDFLFPRAPLSEAVAAEMTSSISELEAQGKTPIAEALLAAVDSLAGCGGDSGIVLVSDGEETCGGDPVAVAEMIAAMVPPITLHVIGLDVEEGERAKLMGMAEACGGVYSNVSEAQGLFAALFAAVSLPQEAEVPQVPPEYACLGITNVVLGTDGRDTLRGTSGNDLIYGFGGDDLIMGLGGDDILLGGPGNDILEGGEGADVLIGDDCHDTLFGGAGNDLLCGGPGNDSLEGEAGDDVLCGGTGKDALLGGIGNDELHRVDDYDMLLEGTIVEGPCESCMCLNPTCPHKPDMCPPVCSTPAPVDSGCITPMAKSVDEGTSIRLHGAVIDHDCNIAEVYWRADYGEFDDPVSLDPLYYAPLTDCCQGEDVHVTLTATDTCGATGTDSFVLHINNLNHVPIVDAGEDLAVDERNEVKLTCLASDPDGDMISYMWTAECGYGSFDDPTLLHPCYKAPETARCEGERITLTLTVTDECGAQSRDSLVVHVRNVNQAPVADAGADIAIDECGSVRLTCSATDPDGDALTYCWSAEGGRGRFDDPTLLHPLYVAPATDNCEGERLIITFKVTDACGASSSDSLIVHVKNVNHPPVVKADP